VERDIPDISFFKTDRPTHKASKRQVRQRINADEELRKSTGL
jgi:hypothetical protein